MAMQIRNGVMLRLTPRKRIAVKGPWRVISTCPSEIHNTSGAARGEKRCTCPRALELRPLMTSRLPGGGPWRILSQCPARFHNAPGPAKGRYGPSGNMREVRCVCPRALALRPMPKHQLPGGGPWRILDTCSARHHNTLTASISRLGEGGACTCPRAIELRPRALATMREKSRRYADVVKVQTSAGKLEEIMVQRAQTVNPLTYTGPWRIVDECHATGHNTLNRGLGRTADRVPCVCPHARELVKEHRIRQAAASRLRVRTATPSIKTLKPVQVPDGIRAADLSRGRCVTHKTAPAIFDAAHDAASALTHAAVRARSLAKAMCLGQGGIPPCPVLALCRSNVLRDEDPAGSFGGIIAGMSMTERRAMASRVKRGAA